MRRLRRWFESRRLLIQHLLVGAVPTLALAGLAHRVLALPQEVVLAVLLTGGSCTAAAAALAWQTAKVLRGFSIGSQVLRRSTVHDEHNFPLSHTSADVQRACVSLRRLVEGTRRRQRVLVAHAEVLGHRLEARTHELSTLQNLSIGLASKSDLNELVDEALGALEQTMAYSSASVWSRGEREAGGHVVLMGYRHASDQIDQMPAEDLTGMRLSRQNLQRYEQIEREGLPVVENQVRQSLLSWLWSFLSDDARTSELYRSTRAWMAVPLKSRESVMGVLRVDHSDPDYFDEQRMRLLSAVGSQTGLAMRHAQLLAQQKDMAVVAERNRIARDLHDAVSQTLFAANVIAGTVATLADRGDLEAGERLRRQAQTLQRLNRGALSEMRLLMFELRPDAIEQTPLAELLGHAIEALACRGEVVVTQQLDREDRLPAAVRVQLYRIAQEALSNVARHSGASEVLVRWQAPADGPVVLTITDNGRGFETGLHRPGHFGLGNMADRAAEIGARLEFISSPDQGTSVRIEHSTALISDNPDPP
ncbi:GAF domain-containing protein [Sphaerotilus hippei]|uniref:GAF domain-containing protein n=1 Tax=Sphaerotilus hippei TaxID=744406 RepID=A0A318H629_9BURK|nr:GAF domain-containing sensor histidine kinase [Sphaerotilus hippei]PXW94723.1 GAF domain-containing protein [Sphaerotilus hippei]